MKYNAEKRNVRIGTFDFKTVTKWSNCWKLTLQQKYVVALNNNYMVWIWSNVDNKCREKNNSLFRLW